MPRSNNPYDLIAALEDRCKELTMNASSDINAAEDIEEENIEEEDDIIDESSLDGEIDPEFASVRQKIIDYDIATADEIDLVCDVEDKKNVNILNKIITSRTGYDDIETYIGEEASE